jgi:glycosyltransferase involved in cell wall biosynthesis
VYYPKISIVTPSFNQGQYIEQTILSVLEQNYPNLEYIIIDGGSTDNTLDILKIYAKHLTYWVSEPDRGQSSAINKGISKCTGEVFNWLNSDDTLVAGALHEISSHFSNPSCDVLCGRMRVMGTEEIWGPTVTYKSLAKTLGMSLMVQPSTFFRLAIINQLGSLSEKLHYTMDQELWRRYLIVYGMEGIVLTDSVLANFRIHENSKSCSQINQFEIDLLSIFYELARKSKLYQYEKILESIATKQKLMHDYQIALSTNPSHAQLLEKAINYFLLKQAELNLFNNQSTAAVSYLRKINPLKLETSNERTYWLKLFISGIFSRLK